jgi:predicted nucleic acid-binding protein
MKPVFGDTFYFLAYLNETDTRHARAMAAARQFFGRIVTTHWVLTELADAFAKSVTRRQLAEFVRSLERDEAIRVVSMSRELFERGLDRYAERVDKQWPLTDCISFVVMEDEGITEALTADHHFEQAGFTMLLK